MTPSRWRRALVKVTVGLSVAMLAAGCSGPASSSSARDGAHAAAGPRAADPLGNLLAASTDLGRSSARNVQALVTLPGATRPQRLEQWAQARNLRVRWQGGQRYATVSGPAGAMSAGFDVAIHDYRARSGTRFYASATAARVPAVLHGAVTGVGTILSYLPKLERVFTPIRSDVPDGGLTASQLLRVYGADQLATRFTGKGATIVFFEIDGFAQSDLDKFDNSDGLSNLTPTVDTMQPGRPEGETTMDLEVAHAIVPDAKLVVYDARLKATSIAEVGTDLAGMFSAVDKKYPGATWSISLGLRCEQLFSLADLQPAQDALQSARTHGTSAFVSSGDTGGLECKGGTDYASPPNGSDAGVNAFGTLPAITVVGGTALSTDKDGNWVGEQTWTDSALQQGTSGGPSTLFTRPSWQQAAGISGLPHNTFRMTPDVAADADPATGVRIVFDGEPAQGGGTSQSAPIWAGITVLMNQYLQANGGKAITNLNELLYQVAARSPSAFHDVTLGGSSTYSAGTGFDYVTGLGSPNVAVLAPALLAAQKGQS